MMFKVLFVLLAASSVSQAKDRPDPAFMNRYESRVQCLEAFLDTAKQAGYKSSLTVGKSNSCYFCGQESPVFTRMILWSHDGKQSFIAPSKRGDDVTIFEAPSQPLPNRQYSCFVDEKGRQLGRAFIRLNDQVVFDSDPLVPVACGKAAKNAIGGQTTTKNTIPSTKVPDKDKAQLREKLTQAIEDEAKNAMQYLSYEKLKGLASKSLEVQFLAKLTDSSCKSASPELSRLADETQELGRRVAARVRLERQIDTENLSATVNYNHDLLQAQATGKPNPAKPAKRLYPAENVGVSTTGQGQSQSQSLSNGLGAGSVR